MITIIVASVLSVFLPAEHVQAATAAAEKYHYEPELLLAIGFIESNHTSKVTKKARKGIACGPTQVRATSPEHCERLRTDINFAYLEGARALKYFKSISGGDLKAALRGYGCGHALNSEGNPLKPARPMSQCNGFDSEVMRVLEQLRSGQRPTRRQRQPKPNV